jgi:hypothetical protein
MQASRRLTSFGLLAAAGMVAAVGVGPLIVTGADHLDAPSAKADHRVDITDVYAFRTGARNTALVLNVDGLMSPASTKGAAFRRNTLYELKIDTSGDGAADIAYRVRFSTPTTHGDGTMSQAYTVRRATGAASRRNEWTGPVVATGVTTRYGKATRISSVVGGGRVFAGPRDDPFFFDLVAFTDFKTKLLATPSVIDPSAFCNPTGEDTFAGTNVLSIVIKLPNAKVGGAGKTVGVFATTSVKTGYGWQQLDRMGRPAINTVFNHTDATKEANNRTSPTDDQALLRANVIGVLTALKSVSTYTDAQIAGIADVLLPDTLTVKIGMAGGFLNGRRLNDDVIDAELSLVLNGKALTTGDCVNANDKTNSGNFPYLASPH